MKLTNRKSYKKLKFPTNLSLHQVLKNKLLKFPSISRQVIPIHPYYKVNEFVVAVFIYFLYRLQCFLYLFIMIMGVFSLLLYYNIFAKSAVYGVIVGK